MALLILISIAYLGATIRGQVIKHQGFQKYLGRVNEHDRIVRRHSSFYIGLSVNMRCPELAEGWLAAEINCSQLISDLLRLTSNQRLYYQRGERAKNLILARL